MASTFSTRSIRVSSSKKQRHCGSSRISGSPAPVPPGLGIDAAQHARHGQDGRAHVEAEMPPSGCRSAPPPCRRARHSCRSRVTRWPRAAATPAAASPPSPPPTTATDAARASHAVLLRIACDRCVVVRSDGAFLQGAARRRGFKVVSRNSDNGRAGGPASRQFFLGTVTSAHSGRAARGGRRAQTIADGVSPGARMTGRNPACRRVAAVSARSPAGIAAPEHVLQPRRGRRRGRLPGGREFAARSQPPGCRARKARALASMIKSGRNICGRNARS